MVRARKGAARRQAKRRLFQIVKGYWGGRRRLLRTVKVAILRSRRFAFRDRRTKKRNLRNLWIIRINAACRSRGTRYSLLMAGLKANNVNLNRKVLAHIAIVDPAGFDKVVSFAKKAPAKAAVAAAS